MVEIKNKNSNFYKNHLVKKFLTILEKNPGLEIRIIGNQLIGTYWKSEVKRLNHFVYILPEKLKANFACSKKNIISGISFEFFGSNYKLILPDIKYLYNLVLGIIKPHEIGLEIHGTGFRFNTLDEYPSKNKLLEINAGFNEIKRIIIPEDIHIKRLETNCLNICSNDLHKLTSFAALIKNVRPLNRYKLRGIKFSHEKFIPKAYKKSK